MFSNKKILHWFSVHYALILHTFFWVLYFTFLTRIFSEVFDLKSAIIRVIVGGILHALAAYINILLLLPKFLDKKKYKSYLIGLALLIAITTVLRTQIGGHLGFEVGIPGIEVFAASHYFAIAVSFLIVIVISTGYKFGTDWFLNQKIKANLKNEKLQSELNFLKAQVNPHFLFNTLNNIYSLCYMKSEKAAPMVMKLSEIMRYMLYDCKANKVLLTNEIAYLKNFVALNQLKSEKPQQVTFEVEGNIQNIKIAPLLLINILENAFKHSEMESNKSSWIKINLEVDGNKIHFSVANNSKILKTPKSEYSGIGLENFKQRLELIYPKKYQLQISETQTVFEVSLSVEWK